jgi:hypothetical protein
VKKVFGIVLALALVLTMAVASAVPAAAVSAGTVNVCVGNPLAMQNSTYCISFHNEGTLKGADNDTIDIMFPTGTNVFWSTVVTVQKSPAPPPEPTPWCAPCDCDAATEWGPPASPLTFDSQKVGNQTIRIILYDAAQYVEKCNFVLIVVDNVTNPMSCSHHLEVGTSTHTPVDSEPYTIYCAKVELNGGVNPNTGLAVMNLISLPCYPIDSSIEAVLVDLFLRAQVTAGSAHPFSFSVWYYDNANKEWLKYASDTSFTDLKTIEAGKAYWIKPSTNIDIYIHGYPYIGGQGPPVKWCYPFCWNMVGFASTVAMNASEYLDYTVIPPAWTSAVQAIWRFDNAATNQWYVDTGWRSDGSGDFQMVPGRGYWMAFIAEACIIPPAPVSD